jgi:hypothetical protein
MIKASSIVAALLILAGFTAKAQQLSDTTFVADARNNALNVYTQAISVQSHLFNGSEYKEHILSADEYPFLHDDVMTGNVKYAGELYTGVPLWYDLELDQVITSYPHGNKVQLLRHKVEYFEIANHKFVFLDNKKVATGFYDQLYDGKMKFYVRKVKVPIMKVNSNGGEARHVFELRTKYLLFKNGVYHTVKSKRSVMIFMKDKKKELKRALRAKKLVFNRDREEAITFLLSEYERTQ